MSDKAVALSYVTPEKFAEFIIKKKAGISAYDILMNDT